jgi:hypothetical protein
MEAATLAPSTLGSRELDPGRLFRVVYHLSRGTLIPDQLCISDRLAAKQLHLFSRRGCCIQLCDIPISPLFGERIIEMLKKPVPFKEKATVPICSVWSKVFLAFLRQ